MDSISSVINQKSVREFPPGFLPAGKIHQIGNSVVELGVDSDGGHLWPVRFKGPRGWIEPMHRAAWVDDATMHDAPPVMKKLSGDFFAAPFGPSDIDPTETRPHGATANGRWKWIRGNQSCLELQLESTVLGASVTKKIHLNTGEPIVYQEHQFHGGTGRLPVGHHAMLRLHEPVWLSCSPRIWAGTPPEPVETNPALGRSLLAYPQEFQKLSSVQLASGVKANLEKYPQLHEHEDIVMLTSSPREPLAWFAVVNPSAGWLWFSLKSPATLPSTLLWMSNGGRFYPPFSRRHTHVLGVEEAVSFFHLGHRASTEKNFLEQKSFPTALELRPDSIVSIRYAFGAAPIPDGFQKVVSCTVDSKNITFSDEQGRSCRIQATPSFLI